MRKKLLRAFRNSYLAALLIFGSAAHAQNLTPVIGPGQIHEAIQTQTAFMLPSDTVLSNAINADTCRQVALKDGTLYRYDCVAGRWQIIVSGNLLDSARRSNDTLYFRTSSGDEIAIKMEGIKIPGVNGLQDSLTARYTKAQADARFIQGNQTITLSGDVTGSGTTAITTALKNTGTAGTYTKVITDPEGRVSSGTTLSAGDIPDLSSTYIPLTQKGAASGVATLGMDGKVPSSQLPTTGSLYQGTWNASTNTPAIADGVGTVGWYYRVNVAGTQDLGSGDIAFSVGDDVIYNGSVWQRIPGGSAVNSVNGYTGDVVLLKGDVGLGNVDNTSDVAKPVSTATQTALNLKANSAITMTAGTGLTGGGNLTANRSFAVNFGTAAGTVAQGDDSRINNGQTAFGWGNHASAGYLTTTTGDARYPQLSGSYANPSWLSSLAWSKITGAPSSFPTSSNLQTVLTNGNSALTNILLGANGNVSAFAYQLVRNLAGSDHSGNINITGSVGTGYGLGLLSSTRGILIPDAGTAPYFTTGAFGSGNSEMWHSNNHPAGTTGSITYTGAEVPSSFSFNSAGHYTASGKRTLTPANIGAVNTTPTALSWDSYITGATSVFYASSVSAPNANPWYGFSTGPDANNAAQLAMRSGSIYFRTRITGVTGAWEPIATQSWTTSNFAAANIPLNTVLSNGNSSGYQVQITGISGAPSSGAGLELAGSTTTGYVSAYNRGTSTALPLRISHTGGNTYINEGTGNVGIGTTTPATKLEVNGTITAPVLQSPSGSDLNLYTAAGHHLTLGAGGAAKVIMDDNGRVAIGGAVPNSLRASLLEVGGNVWSTDAYLLGTGSIPIMEVYLNGGDAGMRMMNSTAKMTFDVGSTGSINAMTISPSGDIGIGTATPTEKLEVNGMAKVGNLITTGITAAIRIFAASTGVTGNDYTLVNTATSGTPVVSLPSAAGNTGRILILVEEAANTANMMNWTPGITYKGASYTNFNNPTLSGYSRLTIQSDGTVWRVIAGM